MLKRTRQLGNQQPRPKSVYEEKRRSKKQVDFDWGTSLTREANTKI